MVTWSMRLQTAQEPLASCLWNTFGSPQWCISFVCWAAGYLKLRGLAQHTSMTSVPGPGVWAHNPTRLQWRCQPGPVPFRAQNPVLHSRGFRQDPVPCCWRTEAPTLPLSVSQAGSQLLEAPQFLPGGSLPGPLTALWPPARSSRRTCQLFRMRLIWQSVPWRWPSITSAALCNLIKEVVITASYPQIIVYKEWVWDGNSNIHYILFGIYKQIQDVKTIRKWIFPWFIYPLRYFVFIIIF